MRDIFVVSDIHGEYDMFLDILQYWDSRLEDLVILGDMVDRGNDSFKVVEHVKRLQDEYGVEQVHVLKGNHEDMMDEYFYVPSHQSMFIYNGGQATLDSFFRASEIPYEEYLLRYTETQRIQSLEKEFKPILDWLFNLPLAYQTGKLLFTHAGFQSFYADWKNTNDSEYLWIRGHYKYKNETGLVNVFGHTPVINIHGSHDPYISRDKMYVGIDGGSCFGGQLNGVVFDRETGKIKHTYKSDMSSAF